MTPCHYCTRTSGKRTRDHKQPRARGGTNEPKNLVKACVMCNVIKTDVPYDVFAPVFEAFLAERRDAYLAADPDDYGTIRIWQRRFTLFLRRQLPKGHPFRPLSRKKKARKTKPSPQAQPTPLS